MSIGPENDPPASASVPAACLPYRQDRGKLAEIDLLYVQPERQRSIRSDVWFGHAAQRQIHRQKRKDDVLARAHVFDTPKKYRYVIEQRIGGADWVQTGSGVSEQT